MAEREEKGLRKMGGSVSSVSKVGKPRADNKQRKLVTEDKETKKVTFRIEEGTDGGTTGEKSIKILQMQFNKEIQNLKEERKIFKEYLEARKTKDNILEISIKKMGRKMEELEKWVNEKIDNITGKIEGEIRDTKEEGESL